MDSILREEIPVSPFVAMRLVSASAEYSDCDGGCDDGNVDNY